MGNDPIPSLSQSNVQTTTLLTPLIGTAGRNQTSIPTFVAWCPIHWTTAILLVSVAGIEPTLQRPKRRVIPFHHTEKIGAPWQNRTAVTWLQNRRNTIILIGRNFWCGRRDLNPQSIMARHFKCLVYPVPPLPHMVLPPGLEPGSADYLSLRGISSPLCHWATGGERVGSYPPGDP